MSTISELEKLDRARAVRAAHDFNAFAEYLGLKQAPMHRRWDEILTERSRAYLLVHPGAGATTQMAILRPVWELGQNPNLRITIVVGTPDRAHAVFSTIMGVILNERTRRVFPSLRVVEESRQSLVVDRGVWLKDPSVSVLAVYGACTSMRTDRLVIDNPYTPDCRASSSHQAREAVERWIRTQAYSRLVLKGRRWFFSEAVSHDDMIHSRLANGYRTGVQADGITYVDRFPVSAYKSMAFSPERICGLMEDLGPVEFSRQMLCLVGVNGASA